MVVLGEWGISDERGTPVAESSVLRRVQPMRKAPLETLALWALFIKKRTKNAQYHFFYYQETHTSKMSC